MNVEEKQAAYEGLLEELASHFVQSASLVARMATVAALLKARLKHFFWIGFYLLADGELTIGPYQGSPACIVLPAHQGVCWMAIDRGGPIVVPNVHTFPGHIACDGRANSEVVIPMRDRSGRVLGVLDADSGDFDAFEDLDVLMLSRILHAVTG